MRISMISRRLTTCATLLVCGALTSACSLNKQTAPDAVGPSEFGLSLALTATPDHLVQDGKSQVTVLAVVRDAQGAAVSGIPVQWAVFASDNTFVEPSAQRTVTDTNGRASTVVTAPAAPSALPTTPVTLVISATPVGTDLSNASPRSVSVQLVPPTGTLPTNHAPVAAFTITPSVVNISQDITFNAASTTDEGSTCGSRCTYDWDFGDFTVDSGVSVMHRYSLPGSYTVTLTVTDDRGGVASTARTITVNGPAAPSAVFTVSPSSPAAGATVIFDATASTVGTGATIDEYVWVFGDGSAAQTATVPAVSKSFASAGVYIVTLTVTDSLGRQASRTSTVTVH